MMKKKNLILTAAMALLTVNAATAQEDIMSSYTYVEAQGGLQMTSTNADMKKLMTPTAAISVGHYFTPVVGARLHVNAWQAKSGFKDLDQYYKWKYITPSADLLLNLSNLVCKTPDHPLNVILLGGIGLNYAWDNDELKDMGVMVSRTPLAWKDNKLSHNLRAGLRLETNVTKALGLSLEVDANSTDDRFNAKTNDQDDWQFTAMLGLSFRFGKSYRSNEPTPIVRTVVKKQVDEDNPDINPNIPKAPKNDLTTPETTPVTPGTTVKDATSDTPATAEPLVDGKTVGPKTDTNAKQTIPATTPTNKETVKKETLSEEIFYVICKSDPTESGLDQMQRVADFMKKYKDAKVTIVGYADKGTGNPQINKMYAERRATECRDVLVKKYGCDRKRIIIDSKGDTVQPFAENDKNRCVIIGSETQVTTVK